MRQATRLWSHWQALLRPFALAFTRPGYRRFVEWITALALNVEEHTITQSVTALGRVADWKAMESFAEYGAWDVSALTRSLARLVEQAPGRIWHGYHVSAVDDTKIHRSGKHVWGTCTFHEYTARCPNRATTVRAHNWVVCGALLRDPDHPAKFLPVSGRLYFRKSQLPARSGVAGPREAFRTKCELAVELVREQARTIGSPHLVVFDGGYALKSVVRPLVAPEGDHPRVEFLTRLRHDARLHALPPKERRKGQRGPDAEVGQEAATASPGRVVDEGVAGGACLYLRPEAEGALEGGDLPVAGLGPEVPVKAVVAQVEGYKKRFALVTSAVALTGLQMVELFAARFRQEDGFRDLKQRLGWEECRAWTRNPIERTSQAQWVTMSLLRLLQFRLDAEGCVDWWTPPPWNRKKDRPSVLDVERLLRRHRPEIQQLLAEWLGNEGEAA